MALHQCTWRKSHVVVNLAMDLILLSLNSPGNATRLLTVQRSTLGLLNVKSQQFNIIQTSVSDAVALTYDIARGLHYWADGRGSIYKTIGRQSWAVYTGKSTTSFLFFRKSLWNTIFLNVQFSGSCSWKCKIVFLKQGSLGFKRWLVIGLMVTFTGLIWRWNRSTCRCLMGVTQLCLTKMSSRLGWFFYLLRGIFNFSDFYRIVFLV